MDTETTEEPAEVQPDPEAVDTGTESTAEEPGQVDSDPGSSGVELTGPTWLSIKEAAERLGIATKTVRRRIKSGAVGSQRSGPDPQAPWLVRLQDLEALYGPAGARPPQPTAGERPVAARAPEPDLVPAKEFDDLARRYHELVGQIQSAAERVGRAEEKAEQYRERLADARTEAERLRAELAEARLPRRWWRRKD